MTAISIKHLLEEGIAKQAAEKREHERTKVGTLRAGNSGALALGGKVVGKCARLTYLRFKGIDVAEDVAEGGKNFMFEAGIGNEDIWYQALKAAWDGPILREEEVPIRWQTSTGVSVTGRPDLVLCDDDKRPVRGLELKLVSSLWTALSVGFKLEPKTDHLLQAGHYAWQLGVPFEIWYTNRTNFAINADLPRKGKGAGWLAAKFPQPGQLNSDRLKYVYYVEDADAAGGYRKVDEAAALKVAAAKRRAVPKDVLPFAQGYEVSWNAKGQLMWRAVGTEEWAYTLITQDGIRSYYESVARAEETDELLPKPGNLLADGEKQTFNNCDYCPLKDLCKQKHESLSAWVQDVCKTVEGGRE